MFYAKIIAIEIQYLLDEYYKYIAPLLMNIDVLHREYIIGSDHFATDPMIFQNRIR